MTGPTQPTSWQYRELNQQNPDLDYFSDALIELVDEGHAVIAGSADLPVKHRVGPFGDHQTVANRDAQRSNRVAEVLSRVLHREQCDRSCAC